MKNAIGMLFSHGFKAKVGFFKKMMNVLRGIYFNNGKVKRE